MRRLILLLLALTLAAGADTLQAGGRERSYLLFVPPNASGKLPVVVVLHDEDSSPVAMARLTGLTALASKNNFCVVYPEAINKSWNDGRQKLEREAEWALPDDVDFVSTLVSTLVKSKPVDPSRVYVMGYGNGAMLALRLGVERPDLFAAVGAVGGSLPERVDAAPGKPLSLIVVNGTVDRLVPDRGGPIQAGVELGRVLSSEATARRFASADGCAEPPAQEKLFPNVEANHWKGGRNGTEVLQVRVLDSPHVWPQGFDLSAMLWDFFSRQRRP